MRKQHRNRTEPQNSTQPGYDLNLGSAGARTMDGWRGGGKVRKVREREGREKGERNRNRTRSMLGGRGNK
jgi:hypothetical protein